MKSDAVVLGAGIVGISVALHLQARGRAVALVDRRGAAEETSFGNAGLIQREGVYPYGFPHDYGALVRYGFNRTIDAHYHPSAVAPLAPFLWKYWHHSRPARHEKIAHVYAKLIEHCVTEHDALAQESGATGFLQRIGWMKVFRTERERDLRWAEAERWKREYGLNYRTLDRAALQEAEPHLAPVLVGGLHWTDPVCVNDPQGLALAYAALFEKRGGRFVQGNATSLEAAGDAWRVRTAHGPVQAQHAVIALGPWADTLTRALGYQSMLVAAKVDPEHPWRPAKIVNAHPGVSHNYLRNHEFNMWFTLAVEEDSKLGLQGTLDVLQELTGAESIRQLPTLQLFLYRYSSGLVAPANTNTGLNFVTRTNVHPFLTTKSRFEGSSEREVYPVTS